jgi:rhamnose transport system ATP-binding protein
LEEVFSISQRITVMRDGQVVGSGPLGEWTTEEVIRKMVGRSLDALYPKENVEPGEVVLRTRDLRRAGVFKGISFEVRKGEIVGLAGLVGAGRSEVARAIFGIDSLDSGEVSIGGKALTNHTPQMAMAAGIGFVPEDRQQQGFMRNATLTVLREVQRFGLVSQEKEKEIAARWTQRMLLKGHIEEPVNILSGGNQQKVVLAKWLATKPKLLIVDEPTRGVDVGAKSEVHRTLSQLAKEGMAIIMISSDLPEVIGMADRVLVMHEGKLTAELTRSEATEEAIMFAATGQTGPIRDKKAKVTPNGES